MKVTKSQLRRIIKEEKAKILKEVSSPFERALEARDTVMNHMDGGSDHDEIMEVLEELYPDLRKDWTAIINDAADLYDIRGLR